LAAQTLATTGCSKSSNDVYADGGSSKGVVKGKVTYEDGTPIPNTRVVIENTIFYASDVFATTNAKGEYSVPVPIGSWKASVQIEKAFLGKKYKYDLHPDNPNSFAGVDGAVRNFTWKISGANQVVIIMDHLILILRHPPTVLSLQKDSTWHYR
jgi:hypothetical protein